MSCVSGSVRSRLEGQLELGALPTETVSRDHSHEAWCELVAQTPAGASGETNAGLVRSQTHSWGVLHL